MDAKKIIVYLSIIFNGDFHKIYEFIKNKEIIKASNQEVEETINTLKCKYITILDEDYPEFLKAIAFPPLVIFYYGDFSILRDYDKNVALIGSRKNSSYGGDMAFSIARDLAKNGYVIVSGLAKGIDSIAHKGAIEGGGKTVAILGSGIDYCYPSENKELYDEIKSSHLLISEYPNKSMPTPEQFPWRNRIIAGLSNTIVVAEAGIHSGTYITVADGLMNGRNICCVPHMANLNSGCNKLIKEGAALVENAKDVIDEMTIYKK